MYFRIMNATERAMNLIIDAQRECENMYLGIGKEEIPSENDADGESEKAL